MLRLISPLNVVGVPKFVIHPLIKQAVRGLSFGVLVMLSLWPYPGLGQVSLDVNSADWPPFFLNERATGQPGLARELMNLCVNSKDYTLRYMQLPIKRTHQYMQSGELDLAVYSFKPDRESFVWYSAQPLFHSEIGVAVKTEFIQPIEKEADLEPWRIGYLAGLALTPTLAVLLGAKKTKTQAVEAYSMELLFDQLVATPNRIDLVINSRESLLWMASRDVYAGKVKVLDFSLERKPYYLTVSRNSRKLAEPVAFLAKFDACVQQAQRLGDYQRLFAKYQLQVDAG